MGLSSFQFNVMFASLVGYLLKIPKV